ncbi:MAG: peroxiredoxin family protein, partial [Blastocatellia bacterium]
MLQTGYIAPSFSLRDLRGQAVDYAGANHGKPALLVFLETDCPTCALTAPYLNRLAAALGHDAMVLGISQDGAAATSEFVKRLAIDFPVVLDEGLYVSKAYDPLAVPTLFLADARGKIAHTSIAFDKAELNTIAAWLCVALGRETMILADPYDGAPAVKPGCTSRHMEPEAAGADVALPDVLTAGGARASRIEVPADVDAVDYCLEAGFDPLPVAPPTVERVARMLRATTLPPAELIARIPPNYGAATVEKIAAAAVMAGCKPEMMRVLLPLVRAVCDERYNIHGIQATTHFAAPLIIINGPVRHDLGFVCGGNVMSNVARANSTLGRALQLLLTNIGGAKPG